LKERSNISQGKRSREQNLPRWQLATLKGSYVRGLPFQTFDLPRKEYKKIAKGNEDPKRVKDTTDNERVITLS